MYPFYEVQAENSIINRLSMQIEKIIVEESNIMRELAVGHHLLRDEFECFGNIDLLTVLAVP